MEKDQLQCLLKKLERRIGFRSDDRVKTSLFFHVLFSVLDQMNSRNEDDIEKELNERNGICFAGYYDPYKVNVKIEFIKIGDDNGNSTASAAA